MKKSIRNTLLFAALFLMAFSGCEPEQYIRPRVILVTEQSVADSGAMVLEKYMEVIRQDGLIPQLLSAEWQNPEQIRDTLLSIKNKYPMMEGAVLIGRLPIPMIRGAQHLASAFKMDEDRYPFPRSSVPSDRFYDDPDLKFDFLEQDSLNPLLFYYRLRHDSPQRIEKDFYSSRIFPDSSGAAGTRQVITYLEKVVKIRQTKHLADSILTFAGHGYWSESLNAWADMQIRDLDHFPAAIIPGGEMKHLFFTMDDEMKTRLTNELAQPRDMTIFHTHGGVEAQYLLGFPLAKNTSENKEAMQYYFRSKVRSAKRWKKTPEDVIQNFMKQYDVPESWFEGVFDAEIIKADSIYAANLDIFSEDLAKMQLNSLFVMHDQCFNGNFPKENYVVSKYLFSAGRTIVSMANSVNVKQDIWSMEGIEMLSAGYRIGQWHQRIPYLENHLFGDPTFAFTPFEKKCAACPDAGFANRELEILKGVQNGEIREAQLLNYVRHDPVPMIRLQAACQLANLRSDFFYDAITVLLGDPDEFNRRIASHWAGRSGDSSFVAPLAKSIFFDPSERVVYAAKDALDLLGHEAAIAALLAVYETLPPSPANDTKLKRYTGSYQRTGQWLESEFYPALIGDTLSQKEMMTQIRRLRNYPFEAVREPLQAFCTDTSRDESLRVAALEALGWFHLHKEALNLAKFCQTISENENESLPVRFEAEKTARRLKEGPNHPVTP
jgi:hypothetical protein